MYTDSTGCYPLQTAFELLNTWLLDDEEVQYYSKGSRIVKQLKKSKQMQSYIDSAIDNYKEGQSLTIGTGEFKAEEDGYELYLSTQHFDYTISVEEEKRTVGFWLWKHEEKRYTATAIVHDKYNFDAFREWDGFGNIMNNLAYAFSIFGGGNDYDWYANYTYSTKWSATS